MTRQSYEVVEIEDFKDYWARNYPECPPLGWRFKQVYQDRWLRIHSLPASKRYAESEVEYQEVFRRQNTVLAELFEEGEEFFLITSAFSLTPERVSSSAEIVKLFPDSRELESVHLGDEDGGERYCHLSICKLKWFKDSLNSLLGLVADWREVNVIFVGFKQQRLFYPYDGGADIIVATAEARDELRERFADWLSQHPLGF
jgi:hypothetical protein